MALLTQYEAYKRLKDNLSGESEKIDLESAQVELPEYGNPSESGQDSGPVAVRTSNLKGSEVSGSSGAQKEYKHNKATGGAIIEGESLPEAVKTVQALGLDLGGIDFALGLVNKGGSIVSHVKDMWDGYKNMSPSEAARNIMMHLNNMLAGTANASINSMRQSLNPWFIWETLGMIEAAEKSVTIPEGGSSSNEDDENRLLNLQGEKECPELEGPGDYISYELRRENILSLKDDYYWIARIKPPFRLDQLIVGGKTIDDNDGVLMSLLVNEFKYNKAKLGTQSMKLALGADVQYPTILVPENNLELTMFDTGDNLIQRILNQYYDAYKDPYGEGIPLPWEWYFEVDIIMFANKNGVLSRFHDFTLYCVPSEGSEYYSGESSHESYGGTQLSMSVIGYGDGGNKSALLKSS